MKYYAGLSVILNKDEKQRINDLYKNVRGKRGAVSKVIAALLTPFVHLFGFVAASLEGAYAMAVGGFIDAFASSEYKAKRHNKSSRLAGFALFIFSPVLWVFATAIVLPIFYVGSFPSAYKGLSAGVDRFFDILGSKFKTNNHKDKNSTSVHHSNATKSSQVDMRSEFSKHPTTGSARKPPPFTEEEMAMFNEKERAALQWMVAPLYDDANAPPSSRRPGL